MVGVFDDSGGALLEEGPKGGTEKVCGLLSLCRLGDLRWESASGVDNCRVRR